jgi:hypothetical protein
MAEQAILYVGGEEQIPVGLGTTKEPLPAALTVYGPRYFTTRWPIRFENDSMQRMLVGQKTGGATVSERSDRNGMATAKKRELSVSLFESNLEEDAVEATFCCVLVFRSLPVARTVFLRTKLSHGKMLIGQKAESRLTEREWYPREGRAVSV